MKTALCVLPILGIFIVGVKGTVQNGRPHIIFMVADDLGWNDVGYHNPDILSPNLDQLATTGILFNHSYVQPLCSPSRSAFMTGYYPFRLGLQHMVIGDAQAVCAPLNKTFLSNVMKKNGYATHMAGKWHLGFCKWECTPTFRGFDSYFGYYNSREDYYTKVAASGFDFRNNTEALKSVKGNYSTFQYTHHITDLINNHNVETPLFLYFPIQSVHEPLQAPEHYYNMYPNIKNKGRRTFSAMVTALDDVIGNLTKALKDKDMYNNTIIFFSSDNGGWIPYHGNNYPLRGGKITIWEGGTRVPGFVHSPLLPKTGHTYDGIIHAVDWFPTILEASKLQYEDPNRDGISHWKSITKMTESPRSEVVYNLDFSAHPTQGRAAIRVGDYKLIDGFPGRNSGWYPPDTVWSGPLPKSDYSDLNISLDKGTNPGMDFKGLFNLKDDPTEKLNLYDSKPDIVKSLGKRLDFHIKRMIPPNYPPRDPAAAPSHYGGVWTPGWC